MTIQVGGRGRSVDEVAAELGCDWHTVNNEVVRWGEALLEADTDRIGEVQAVGIDETLFWRKGRWRTKVWCTSVVDVGGHQLIDIVPGKTAESAAAWFRSQPADWLGGIRWAVLDMSGSYRKAYDRVLPHALQVADPFHVSRLANQRLDEVRRRVQNETLGHRGRKGDPLYGIRRLLTAAHDKISDRGQTRLRGLLDTGDPHGEVEPYRVCRGNRPTDPHKGAPHAKFQLGQTRPPVPGGHPHHRSGPLRNGAPSTMSEFQ